MPSFVPQQRRTPPSSAQAAARTTVETDAHSIALLRDAEPAVAVGNQPHDITGGLRAPRALLPLFHPDAPAPSGPPPQPKQPALPRFAASQPAGPADGEAAPEADAEPISPVAQARVSVKQAGACGTGTAYAGGSAPVQRKSATGLPDALKTSVEALSGVLLDDVRVHYQSAKPAGLDALAYARGTEIHVGPGQDRHLAHEVWHVVQQKQGRVKPTQIAKGLSINDDTRLEREADAMGEKALHAPQRPADRGGTSPSVGRRMSPPPGAVVQRLMSLATFKEASKSDYTIRYFSSVNPIDTALSAYHALPKDNFLGRERQLYVLEDVCQNYLDSAAADDARRVGVRTLLRQSRTEQSYIELLADSERTAGRESRMTALMTALDVYVRLMNRNGPPYDTQWDIRVVITDRILQTANAMTEIERQRFFVHDLSKLEALARDNALPEITRRVVAEVVANAPNVHFAHSTPGATLSRPDVAEKYTVNHWLSQTGGTTERLGSLAHELTHVSISETFNNTSLFLAFAPGSSDDEIKALVATRTAATRELQDLLDDDETFTGDQKALVQSKIDYAKGNKLGLYAARYQDARKITPETAAAIRQLATIANNAVIEYDTVINQMLVYMALWRIAEDNAFYTRLRAIATEAYEYRRAHRGL